MWLQYVSMALAIMLAGACTLHFYLLQRYYDISGVLTMMVLTLLFILEDVRLDEVIVLDRHLSRREPVFWEPDSY